MRFVVDSSVVLKWVLPEINSDRALQLRDDCLSGVHDLIAPDVLPAEIGHALTRSERRRLIPFGQALILFADLMRFSPQLETYRPLMRRAIDLSSAMRIGCYDCIYVALVS